MARSGIGTRYPEMEVRYTFKYPQDSLVEKTYILVKRPMQWIYAKSYAEGIGGHLVTVPNEYVNQFLTDKLKENRLSSAWIGLNDEAQEGDWEWHSGSGANYRKWDGREPNNSDSDFRGEDHCCLQNSSFWNDLMGYKHGHALPFWVEVP